VKVVSKATMGVLILFGGGAPCMVSGPMMACLYHCEYRRIESVHIGRGRIADPVAEDVVAAPMLQPDPAAMLCRER
jgi:hypothetical protein